MKNTASNFVQIQARSQSSQRKLGQGREGGVPRIGHDQAEMHLHDDPTTIHDP